MRQYLVDETWFLFLRVCVFVCDRKELRCRPMAWQGGRGAQCELWWSVKNKTKQNKTKSSVVVLQKPMLMRKILFFRLVLRWQLNWRIRNEEKAKPRMKNTGSLNQ